MQKIAIFGANGMLGQYVYYVLRTRFNHVIPITRADFNIGTDPFLFGPDDFDIVINCAGIIKRKEGPLMPVNADFPRLLDRTFSDMVENRLIHISTDCVFDGLKGSYQIGDRLNPTDTYGFTKMLGECGYTIRTSFLGEGNPISFMGWLQSLNKGSTVTGFINHFWNGVSCLEIAFHIFDLIQTGKYRQRQIEHVHGFTYTKYQMCNIVNQIYDLGLVVNPVEVNYCNRTLVGTYKSTPLASLLLQQKEYYEKVMGKP